MDGECERTSQPRLGDSVFCSVHRPYVPTHRDLTAAFIWRRNSATVTPVALPLGSPSFNNV
jgi:hypothetical protein